MMPLGPAIRQCLGPLELPVSLLYRACFFRLEPMISCTRRIVQPSRILEVGCGEGLLTQKLAACYPNAHIHGIDITPRIGRLYRGDSSQVSFQQITIQEFARGHPAEFDLVVLCDVMHHLPISIRREFLESVKIAGKPGGLFLLKDWERTPTMIHRVTHFLETHVTGDDVAYETMDYFRQMVQEIFGQDKILLQRRFAPWENNIALYVRF